jgi:DNA repair protein RecO (recombination protein O)
MNQHKTKAIVLSRTNYREADRIITVITPDFGKVHLIAKGVRALKSKLAGGIELFSISDISFIRGRSELATLTSARLYKYYASILEDIDRVQLGYDMLKTINRTTEDIVEEEYFDLLEASLESLNNANIPLEISQLWFVCHLMEISGHSPNLGVYVSGNEASIDGMRFTFDSDRMSFIPQPEGIYKPNHIKYLRLVLMAKTPKVMLNVVSGEELIRELLPIAGLMQSHLLR